MRCPVARSASSNDRAAPPAPRSSCAPRSYAASKAAAACSASSAFAASKSLCSQMWRWVSKRAWFVRFGGGPAHATSVIHVLPVASLRTSQGNICGRSKSSLCTVSHRLICKMCRVEPHCVVGRAGLPVQRLHPLHLKATGSHQAMSRAGRGWNCCACPTAGPILPSQSGRFK